MITILMATYNGEKFIRQQMESLLNQSFKDFNIHVTDDCSTDGTLEILKEYENIYPSKITVIQNKINSGNSKYNFIKMMLNIKDDYVMLCDQDDIWLRDKIKITYEKMCEMEKRYGKNMPLLVHSDLKVVDESLQIISESLISMVNADYSKTCLKNQIVQNTLTGCTAMYNRSLAELITQEPEYMVMHDWWIMLIASAFGEIEYIPDATILYRQHATNVMGTRNMRSFKFLIQFSIKRKIIKSALENSCLQAKSFLNAYRDKLNMHDLALLEEYADILKGNKLKRIITIIHLKTFKNGFLRILGQLIFI